MRMIDELLGEARRGLSTVTRHRLHGLGAGKSGWRRRPDGVRRQVNTIITSNDEIICSYDLFGSAAPTSSTSCARIRLPSSAAFSSTTLSSFRRSRCWRSFAREAGSDAMNESAEMPVPPRARRGRRALGSSGGVGRLPSAADRRRCRGRPSTAVDLDFVYVALAGEGAPIAAARAKQRAATPAASPRRQRGCWPRATPRRRSPIRSDATRSLRAAVIVGGSASELTIVAASADRSFQRRSTASFSP